MAFLRRSKSEPEAVSESEDVEVPQLPDHRANGPWDSSERDTTDDDTYVDLGALQVRGRTGIEIRLQADGEKEAVGAALIVTENAALELRAFAGPRSGGLWADVRADLVAEVERLKGSHEEVDGPFGTELRCRVPVTMPDGEEGFQPSRIIGIDGPRWLLRATLLGQAALEPTDEHVLIDTLRDVVVVRGDGPMAVREALRLTVPERAVVADADEAETPDAE